MSSIITVRNIDSGDKSWLQQEAKDQGVSMEEIVRRLIREKRQKAQTREKPSEVFRRYFGPEHGVELPPRGKYGYCPVEFQDSDEA